MTNEKMLFIGLLASYRIGFQAIFYYGIIALDHYTAFIIFSNQNIMKYLQWKWFRPIVFTEHSTERFTMNTKSVILEGTQLPQALKDAISDAGKDFAVCRITHGDKQVALVSTDWIPLIMRLEAERFTEEEFDELFKVLCDAEGKLNTTVAFIEWMKRLK